MADLRETIARLCRQREEVLGKWLAEPVPNKVNEMRAILERSCVTLTKLASAMANSDPQLDVVSREIADAYSICGYLVIPLFHLHRNFPLEEAKTTLHFANMALHYVPGNPLAHFVRAMAHAHRGNKAAYFMDVAAAANASPSEWNNVRYIPGLAHLDAIDRCEEAFSKGFVRSGQWRQLHVGATDRRHHRDLCGMHRIEPQRTPSCIPSPRAFPFVCVHKPSNTAYLFGGEAVNPPPGRPAMPSDECGMNDMHAFNMSTGAWRKITQRGRIPSPRSRGEFWIHHSTIFLFGGRCFINGDTEADSTTFAYDIEKSTWELVCKTSAKSEGPSARISAGGAYHNGSYFLFGGGSDHHEAVGDMWRFNCTERRWQRAAQEGIKPAARLEFGSGQARAGNLFVYGGKFGLEGTYYEPDQQRCVFEANLDGGAPYPWRRIVPTGLPSVPCQELESSGWEGFLFGGYWENHEQQQEMLVSDKGNVCVLHSSYYNTLTEYCGNGMFRLSFDKSGLAPCQRAGAVIFGSADKQIVYVFGGYTTYEPDRMSFLPAPIYFNDMWTFTTMADESVTPPATAIPATPAAPPVSSAKSTPAPSIPPSKKADSNPQSAPQSAPAPQGRPSESTGAASGDDGKKAKECVWCLVSDDGTGKLKKCGKCRVVYYCSIQCQKEHWKAGHKNDCAGNTGTA